MTIKTSAKALLTAVVLAGCGGGQETVNTASDTEEVNLLSEQMVMSTLWFQTSDEAKQLFEQGYQLAAIRLHRNMENISDDHAPPAVILDIDETVLDNSPYEARLIQEGKTFSRESWAEWVSEANAELLPGVREFMNVAAEAGVEVFYISNRSQELFEPTMRNLRKLELPVVEEQNVLLKTTTSDKTERRDRIMNEYRVVLFVGDQMTDFTQECEQFEQQPELRDSLNRYFVLLPNPMYGGFETKAYGGATEIRAEQKAEMRKELLNPKR